ncbi:uncharacterized protein LOC103314560 isoform X2 [Tribolium castaneum]|uniref:Uncharacterized protein n=1 Tax=Tribolium castaneum TaxID=7070 RepID=A0A139W8Q0_TRICA|nr:PREDICTED: uncharacterized protein LOC103314560 isoform X2 [Tribolium castaneum]KXZ75655.1 hypothetical protein TcasGA2_TC031683 [Tribolium castaneum]|eukprot:XP_008199166.1 PREDICTED: uncharacterized protein LOC103314560 isoform X2 [Tribolium castaneum]
MYRVILLLWAHVIVQGSSEVMLEPNMTTFMRTVDGFSNQLLGVTSGKIVITGNNTLHLTNFSFDGKVSDAHFIVGKGTVSENGTFVPFSESSDNLPPLDNEDIDLTLPNNLTVIDIDWLAIFSPTTQENLGFVLLTKTVQSSPQTFSFDNDVISGPVLLLDKKTLFIPNFRYKGDHKNVRFWVGNGSEPSSDGIALSDEKNSSESLGPYQGQNVKLHLPESLSTDNIDYLAVWSIDEAVSLGYVPIKGVSEAPEVEQETKRLSEGNFEVIVPKCCSSSAVMTSRGCEEKGRLQIFVPNFNIYEHNATHFRNESLDLNKVDFKIYDSTMKCPAGKFPLDQSSEEFALLINGSLLIKGAAGKGIWSQENFCLDNVVDESNVTQMRIFVCVPEVQIQKAMCYTYITFTIISMLCLAATFFIYFFLSHIEDAHRILFTAYVFDMAMVFISLTVVQVGHVEGSGCSVCGFIFQFFMVSSFVMLAILCVDICIIIKYIDNNIKPRKRKVWSLGVGFLVPLFFLIISLIRNLTPDVPNSFFKPQYQTNACYFEAEDQRVSIFYVPIIFSMIVSGISLGVAKYIIVRYDRLRLNDFFWIENGTKYKFMFRQCFITSVIMTISWISNVLMSFLDESSGILKAAVFFEALQGVLIVAVFTMHHYGTAYLETRRQRTEPPVEMNPLSQNNHE